MIELTCQHCGERVATRSLLGVAGKPCFGCGRLLMGPLATAGETESAPDFFGNGPERPPDESLLSLLSVPLMGACVGMLAGVVSVAVLTFLGAAVPHHIRLALLGALSGVLLTPVLAMTSFVSMTLLPFSPDGILGESAWSGVAKAVRHRSLVPLCMPVLMFVALPMSVCGFVAPRIQLLEVGQLLLPAILGAAALGAMAGLVVGFIVARRRKAL